MLRRVAAVTLALAMVVTFATGCQPEPAPSPTGPVFATEEEAFAAAEETYRAYVDALNQVDLSDPETFEAVYAWTTGQAIAGERKSLTRMHADGWMVDGDTVVTKVNLVEFDETDPAVVVLHVCTDVSDVAVTDSSGNSVVAPNRPPFQASVASFTESQSSPTGLLLSTVEGGDHSC